MAKTRPADPDGIPEAMRQLEDALAGAHAESDAKRFKNAGTLAINAAARASDIICDAEIGVHSTSPSHSDALNLLATVPNSKESVADLSYCLSTKSDYNYHITGVDKKHATEIIKAAARLSKTARARVAAKGWLGKG
jgi:hypothetical protein